MILPLTCTLHLAAHGLHLGHNLCFEAWEGKDAGKEDNNDDAMKLELEKDGLVLVMGKGVHLFFIYNEYHHTHTHTPAPQSCRLCTPRGCF